MKTTVAIVQHGPVYLDKEASLAKAERLVKDAAAKGAKVVGFGETWLSGYPSWLDWCPEMGLWDHEPTKEVFAKTYENGISVPGPETQFLGSLAKELGVVIVMGVNEHVKEGAGHGTIYNTLLIFNEKGELANHHRKLMPTYTEKMVYGIGDGNGLQAIDSESGKVGGLICWEHWMPLTRHTMHLSGEEIHVALWPKVHEMHQVASRHYAFEGRCFVMAVGQIMRAKELPSELTQLDGLKPDDFLLNGGSCIIGPNGKYIVHPVWDKEDILIAEIDLKQTIKEKMTLDTTGHYNRNDVFDLQVNKTRK